MVCLCAGRTSAWAGRLASVSLAPDVGGLSKEGLGLRGLGMGESTVNPNLLGPHRVQVVWRILQAPFPRKTLCSSIQGVTLNAKPETPKPKPEAPKR